MAASQNSVVGTVCAQGPVSEAFPHLIFHNFKTALVRRFAVRGRRSAYFIVVRLLASVAAVDTGVSHGGNVCDMQGQRLMTIMKHCFPVPKLESKRVVTFANDSDFVSFRHHVYKKSAGSKDVELVEVRYRQVVSLTVVWCGAGAVQ
jgi:rRNA maturation protein Rpf1